VPNPGANGVSTNGRYLPPVRGPCHP